MRGRPAGASGAGPRAGRGHPALTPGPARSFSSSPRSPRKRRWRRHGGADGSGESHRDGLPQGTRVRQPLKPWPAGIAGLSGLSPSLASGCTPQPDQHHGSRALFTVFLPPGRRLWPSQGTRASRLQWTGERSDGVAGAGGLLGAPASVLTSFPTFPARLMEHEDDPDVDEPLATPLGHVLGREPTSPEQGGPEGPD